MPTLHPAERYARDVVIPDAVINDQCPFVVGDIVTRTGNDEYVILSIDSEWGTLVVLCIKSDLVGFGVRESNLIDRYEFIKSYNEYIATVGGRFNIMFAKVIDFISHKVFHKRRS